MHWILIALIAPILWSVANHTDKFILNRYGDKEAGVGSIMLFTTLFGVIVIPVLFLINPHVLEVSAHDRWILLASGVLYGGFLYFYLKALFTDEASIVIPIFQLIPVFGFIFSYFLLGETLTTYQMIGSVIIILFGILLVWDLDSASGSEDSGASGSRLMKLKWSVLIFTAISGALYALSETIFKVGAVGEQGFVQSLFWNHTGLLVVGVFLLFFRQSRQGFFNIFKKNAGRVLGLNALGEMATLFGDMATRYALLIAPVTLVLVVSGTQPFFVLVIGSLLTLFFPKMFNERIDRKHLIHKIVSIVGITIGSIIILS